MMKNFPAQSDGLVSLLDKEEVKIKIIDKESSNKTRGHRFAQQNVYINNVDDYVEIMRNCCVIVDQNERKQIIIDKAKAEAENLVQSLITQMIYWMKLHLLQSTLFQQCVNSVLNT